jgi:hypothetical protein
MPFGAALMSPRRLGLRRSTFTYIKDTLEMAPTAYRPGPLLKPQATEPGWNGRDEQIAERDSQLRWKLSRFCSIAWFAALCITGVPLSL